MSTQILLSEGLLREMADSRTRQRMWNMNLNILLYHRASLIAQLVKNLPATQETQVLFLGREDPLQKETATHSSILTWRIPGTEESGRLQFMGSQESDMT